MPPTELKVRQLAAIQALLTETTIEAAAEKANVNVRSIYRWLKKPGFIRALREIRQTRFEQSLALLERLSPLAIHTLGQAMRDHSFSPVQIRAAREILRQTQQFIGQARMRTEMAEVKALLEQSEENRHVYRPLPFAKPGEIPGPGTTVRDAGRAILQQLEQCPLLAFQALGWMPDRWQADFLLSTSTRQALLCCRQAGKSWVAAARVMREALIYPGTDVLVFSPTQRQSSEFLRKCSIVYGALGRPVPARAANKVVLELANGSRIISLPDNHEGIVGFSAPRLVVIDEGSRMSDELYYSVRPMLSVSNGTLIVLSTPLGRRGWFFEIWDDSPEAEQRRRVEGDPWRRTRVRAEAVQRISPAFLAEERQALGERWFEQEYHLKFWDAEGAAFSQDAIAAMLNANAPPPLF